MCSPSASAARADSVMRDSSARARLMGLNSYVRRFLKLFWTESPGFLQRLLSFELTDPQDVLARYLFQSNQFHTGRNEALFQAFMPPPDLQLSTFHINGLAEPEILQIGRSVLTETTRPTAKLYGRADLKIEYVIAQ